jgi:hypothetical protein
MSEYYQLVESFTRSDQSQIDALDICAPVGRAIDLAVLCSNFAGFIKKSQMDAALYLSEKMAILTQNDTVQSAVADAKNSDSDNDTLSVKDKAQAFIDTATMCDDEFIGKAITRFDAIYKKDRGILKYDDKPISDFDYRELSFRDRGLIAVGFALVFMQS